MNFALEKFSEEIVSQSEVMPEIEIEIFGVFSVYSQS